MTGGGYEECFECLAEGVEGEGFVEGLECFEGVGVDQCADVGGGVGWETGFM